MSINIKALAFDTGGTILDWHHGIRQAFEDVGRKHGLAADWAALTNTYRRRSLQTMLGAVGPRFNIDDVHRDMLDVVLREQDLAAFTAEDREYIWRTWHQLDAWPDFPPALRRLRKTYVAVSFTILSTSLVIDVSRRNGLDWDCVIACEMLGIYKTRPEAYRSAAKLLALPPEQILMVACHNFDLVAARQEGYRSAFVHRPMEWGPVGPPDPVPHPEYDVAVTDFNELAARLGC
jgi:2-haloacid dehalogenase